MHCDLLTYKDCRCFGCVEDNLKFGKNLVFLEGLSKGRVNITWLRHVKAGSDNMPRQELGPLDMPCPDDILGREFA